MTVVYIGLVAGRSFECCGTFRHITMHMIAESKREL